MSVEVIGLIAGVFTTGAAIPQIIRTYKIKEVKDISLLYYILIVAGCLLWLTYGVYTESIALIFWNIIATVLNGAVLILKIYYDNQH